jgi:hypothetical protein
MKSSENMDDVSTAIHAVKGHLSNIPHEEKSAIVHVQHVRPELVNDKHILQFLRVEKFDINVSYGVCIRPVCLQNSIELCKFSYLSPILSGFDIICYTIFILRTMYYFGSLQHRGSYDIGRLVTHFLDLIDMLSP